MPSSFFGLLPPKSTRDRGQNKLERLSKKTDMNLGRLSLRDWLTSRHYQSKAMFSAPSMECHLRLPVSISSAIAPRPVALIMTGVDVLPERSRTPKHPITLVTLVMSSRTQVLRQSTFRSIFIPANPAFKTHQNHLNSSNCFTAWIATTTLTNVRRCSFVIVKSASTIAVHRFTSTVAMVSHSVATWTVSFEDSIS